IYKLSTPSSLQFWLRLLYDLAYLHFQGKTSCPYMDDWFSNILRTSTHSYKLQYHKNDRKSYALECRLYIAGLELLHILIWKMDWEMNLLCLLYNYILISLFPPFLSVF